MKARVYPYREKIGMGNIVWAERDQGSSYYRVSKYAMSRGRFPSSHPCAPFDNGATHGGPLGTVLGSQFGSSAALTAFHERGYWASCFPEGDGITWKPERGQSDAQCLADIRECFPNLELTPHGPWSI